MIDKRGKMDATRTAENGNYDYSNNEKYCAAKQIIAGEIKLCHPVLEVSEGYYEKTIDKRRVF